MYIEDPAELGMFPEYIQKYLNGDYKSEDYPRFPESFAGAVCRPARLHPKPLCFG